MTSHYRNLLFTPAVKQAQEANGSRAAYARGDGPVSEPDRLGEHEIAFIAERDSFYMATVSTTGWPYLQHRGGPRGFVKPVSDRQLGFADFRGNRQYVSLGNLADDGRAAFFFMDYVNRARLKLLGRVRCVDLAAEAGLRDKLRDPAYKAVIERGFVIDVEAFDWNCPQHITPRYTAEDIAPGIEKLQNRIAELEADNAALRKAQVPAP